jgi:ABC-2 type transport system ATP-binding protein
MSYLMTSPAENTDAKTLVTGDHPLAGASTSGWAIKAVNLTKSYGSNLVIDHLNLSIPYGELYALLGDNGAGKTTTLSMLTTLLKPDQGDIEICGSNVIKQSEQSKRAFGIVSQDIAIYQELTAFENLWFVAQLYGLPRKQALLKIERLLEQSGLTDRANDIVGNFSGGMQRKLTIASALLHEPRVLFMDEPTVGLDPGARRQIWQTLKELRDSGVTILLTTHYLEEAELLADRIGIIRKGKIVVEGTIEDLRHKIQGIRSIAIRLTQSIAPDILKNKLEKLSPRLAQQAKFDPLRSTLSFAQPKDGQLPRVLREILDWLDNEKIPFTRFATSEPNLEEVFMALAVEANDIDEEKLTENGSFEHDYT